MERAAEHSHGRVEHRPRPYGYAADRIPHPNPVKAAQGRTKTRLVTRPRHRAHRRSDLHLADGGQAGAAGHRRAGSTPARPLYPAPAGSDGWAATQRRRHPAQPQVHRAQVFGRHRNRGGKRVKADPAEWLWTPGPVHPAIIDRATWEAAQRIGAEHGTSRDLRPRRRRTPRITCTGRGCGARPASGG